MSNSIVGSICSSHQTQRSSIGLGGGFGETCPTLGLGRARWTLYASARLDWFSRKLKDLIGDQRPLLSPFGNAWFDRTVHGTGAGDGDVGGDVDGERNEE